MHCHPERRHPQPHRGCRSRRTCVSPERPANTRDKPGQANPVQGEQRDSAFPLAPLFVIPEGNLRLPLPLCLSFPKGICVCRCRRSQPGRDFSLDTPSCPNPGLQPWDPPYSPAPDALPAAAPSHAESEPFFLPTPTSIRKSRPSEPSSFQCLTPASQSRPPVFSPASLSPCAEVGRAGTTPANPTRQSKPHIPAQAPYRKSATSINRSPQSLYPTLPHFRRP